MKLTSGLIGTLSLCIFGSPRKTGALGLVTFKFFISSLDSKCLLDELNLLIFFENTEVGSLFKVIILFHSMKSWTLFIYCCLPRTMEFHLSALMITHHSVVAAACFKDLYLDRYLILNVGLFIVFSILLEIITLAKSLVSLFFKHFIAVSAVNNSEIKLFFAIWKVKIQSFVQKIDFLFRKYDARMFHDSRVKFMFTGL